MTEKEKTTTKTPDELSQVINKAAADADRAQFAIDKLPHFNGWTK